MALYPTAFTAGPAFSLVWDRDVNEDLALLYPELYLDLVKVRPGRSMALLRLDLTAGSLVLRVARFPTKPFSPGS